MAESVSRRAALEKAWEHYRTEAEHDVYSPVPTSEFIAGWDALLSEIRPLVADLTRVPRGATRHMIAVERLRELVREG